LPTSPEAIERFLNHKTDERLDIRGKSHEYLLRIIEDTTGVPFQSKLPWTGSERDQRQLEAIAFGILKKRILLYYAMRVGKTNVAMRWLEHLHKCKRIQKALIIPHAPVGVDEWERQTPIHSWLNLSFIRSGSNSEEEFIRGMESDSAGVVLTWSTLQQIFSIKKANRKGKMTLYADKAILRDLPAYFQALIVDEIHKINDPFSLRFEIISEFATEFTSNVPYRMGLTGTPFGRDPYGLWSQARIIDSGETLSPSFFFFREAFGKKEYNHFSKFKQEIVFDKAKLPLLQKKLLPMILTCKLEEIQDVNVIASEIELDLSLEQKKYYKETIKKVFNIENNENQELQNSFIRLRQISSGLYVFIDNDGERRELEIKSSKIDWLEDFVSDLDPKLKVIIFHEFIATGARICKILEKAKIKHERFWSGTKDRAKSIANFQTGNSNIFVANHGAGGTGIDLSAAHYVCIFESPTSTIVRQQMEARPLARGSAPLIVDDLLSSPVERKILSYVREGKELSAIFQSGKKFAKEVGI
jgi:Helicase conserved C-terminal domain/Type III restriction enzyme, res subunit